MLATLYPHENILVMTVINSSVYCVWLKKIDDLQITMTSVEPGVKLIILVNDVGSTNVFDRRLFPEAWIWNILIMVISSRDGSLIEILMENKKAHLSAKLSSEPLPSQELSRPSGIVTIVLTRVMLASCSWCYQFM